MPRNGQPQPRAGEIIHPQPRARKTDLVTREVLDEILVYDLKRHKAHCLNQTAALIWRQCDGEKTVTEIARLIEQDVNSTVDEATVWLAVEQLGKSNLLEECELRSTGRVRLSRRDLIRRLGQGATLALPLVTSIISPLAIRAASCIATGKTGDCTAAGGNNCCSTCCNNTTDICLQTGLATGASCERDCQCTNSTNMKCPSVPPATPRVCV